MITKFVKLYPIKKATAQVITEKVMDCYVLDIDCFEHHSKWAVIVGDVEQLINNCWHEGTGATP
ncbi:hypothetical protein PR048_020423 [Dryococelus australis]|uniref:Uncharacterized protein n=1 Tax=Dryococelus australis TaxID=614101 RepID=A0ABQ9H690_9NEOP|nr:hypothetical protein PR048_020423 [Dryococelus australis]